MNKKSKNDLGAADYLVNSRWVVFQVFSDGEKSFLWHGNYNSSLLAENDAERCAREYPGTSYIVLFSDKAKEYYVPKERLYSIGNLPLELNSHKFSTIEKAVLHLGEINIEKHYTRETLEGRGWRVDEDSPEVS